MLNCRRDKKGRQRKRVRRSLWRGAGPQGKNQKQNVRRSLKRGAGPRTTLLTGSGNKRYQTKRKARRKGHEGEPRECLQPAFTARSSSISMRQNTIERDQPGAERTNFANIYSKRRKIITTTSRKGKEEKRRRTGYGKPKRLRMTPSRTWQQCSF